MTSTNNQRWVLVGPPNTGKTTLYNWLTSSRFKTMNYPGSTVDYAVGALSSRYQHGAGTVEVVDTPGTYSLVPQSSDEEVTAHVLFQHPDWGSADKLIAVIDGTQLSRHLRLVKQIKDCGFSFVVAVTMADLLVKNKIKLDVALLEKEFGVPFVLIDGSLGGGVQKLVETRLSQPAATHQKAASDISTAEIGKMDQLAKRVIEGNTTAVLQTTKNWDKILLHPYFGLLMFLLIMTLFFTSIYWLATPLMDQVDGATGWLAEWISGHFSQPLLADFIANGVILSFGAVLVFVPQIYILFLGLGFLESSGYLARAATLIDRPLSLVGLSGRSFVPLLSGFACAVPALMATRNISGKKERFLANFIIPLMTCSARLPVYALVLAFLYQGEPLKQGLGLALLYIGSLFVGAVASGILNKLLPQDRKSFFMMELPIYRVPKMKIVVMDAYRKTKNYIVKAGPMIFFFAVVIWVGTTFPNYDLENPTEKLQTSYLGQVGHVIEPVFKPMGVDWRVGVSLIAAFAAREVFVSSLAVMMNVEMNEEDSAGLLTTMKEATFPDGTPIFTLASCVAILIFFMIALQCMSTVAVAAKESGSKKFAFWQLLIFNLVGYVLAVMAYQILK